MTLGTRKNIRVTNEHIHTVKQLIRVFYLSGSLTGRIEKMC